MIFINAKAFTIEDSIPSATRLHETCFHNDENVCFDIFRAQVGFYPVQTSLIQYIIVTPNYQQPSLYL